LAEFIPSTTTEAEILRLVDDGLLQSQELVQWRPATGESPSTPRPCELVLFKKFVQRGLALPTCDFLRGLLFFYGIELVNLNPNSILLIAIFVHFCEAFLGIPPHAGLFKHFFYIRPFPGVAQRHVLGGTNFQARLGRRFLDIPFKSSLK